MTPSSVGADGGVGGAGDGSGSAGPWRCCDTPSTSSRPSASLQQHLDCLYHLDARACMLMESEQYI